MAVALAAPALFWKGGVLEEETIVFLRNYWDGRSLAQKVFDPHANDFGTYQARELSYLIDEVDAQCLKALLGRGIDFFVPMSALFASAAIVLVFSLGVRAALPALNAVTATLVLLLYLTNFAFVSTMGLFYRATKPLLAPALLALLFLLCRALHGRSGSHRSAGWALFGLASAMSLLDRQGFFYTALIAAALAAVYARRQERIGPLLAALAATVFGLLYNYVIGPWLVHAVNGYWPRFKYQRLALAKLTNPQFYAQAVELLSSYAGTLLGGLPSGAAGVLALLALGLGLWWWRRLGRRPPVLALLLVLVVGASQVVMFALMIMRYPQVHDWADHRLWYYPLPFQTLMVFGLLVVLNATLPPLGARGHAALQLALAVAIVANVASWQRNRNTMIAGPWFSKTYAQSTLFRESLRQGWPGDGLYGAYRDFYYDCVELSPVLRSRARPDARGGDGFYSTELFEGRVFAWARQAGSLILTLPEGGMYRVEGELWLRPGGVVRISAPGLEAMSVARKDATEGGVPFSLVMSLPSGRTEVRLQSQRPEEVGGSIRERRTAAFGLFFPVAIWGAEVRPPAARTAP